VAAVVGGAGPVVVAEVAVAAAVVVDQADRGSHRRLLR